MDIAVVIPCFRVSRHICDVVAKIGREVNSIYVVDDCCPERSGELVEQSIVDERVHVIRRAKNGGVGAATLEGLKQALADGAGMIVKIDGDGQMDPALIPALVAPILRGEADYAKGNRFYDLRGLAQMPLYRLIGNAVLSFFTKMSSGYWNIFDPTNGFVAIHADVAKELPVEKLSKRYFFETDVLFRLNIIRCVVADVPMPARYGGETSGIVLSRAIVEFLAGNLKNFFKRIFYNYILRDFSMGSLYLIAGLPIFGFGLIFGSIEWYSHAQSELTASAGTVMLAALPVIIGFQLILAFLAYDVQSVPRVARHLRNAQVDFQASEEKRAKTNAGT